MAFSGVQPRPDSAVPGDVATTNARQPSTPEWYLSTVIKTVVGEALYRKFDVASSLTLRKLDFLPNPAKWIGAKAAELSDTIATDPVLAKAALKHAKKVTSRVLEEAINDSGASAVKAAATAETVQTVADATASTWTDLLPNISSFSMPNIPDWVKMPNMTSLSMPNIPNWVKVPSMPSLSMPNMPEWVKVPNMPSLSLPSMPEWVTIPTMPSLSWPTFLKFEMPSMPTLSLPSTPEFVTSGLEKGRELAQWSFTNIGECLSENMDWVGPTAAIALSAAAINHFASRRVNNSFARYTLSSLGGVVTVWGASQLASLATGNAYQVGFETAADIGFRMVVTGVLGQVASPFVSKGMELAHRVVVEPLSWSLNKPFERTKVKQS